MSAPVLAFRNPKPPKPRRERPTPAAKIFIEKATLLAKVRPNAFSVIERLVDDLLKEKHRYAPQYREDGGA